MDIQIQIDTVAGQAKIKRLLDILEPKTILTAVGGRFLSYIDESFRTRGRGGWRSLSPNTLLLRRQGGDMPLQDTGKYKGSFPPPLGRGSLKTDNRTYIVIGATAKTQSGIPLANIHEKGTGPYVIAVRRAKVLAAQTRMGQWLIFGKRVDHPGIPARPVLPDYQTADRLARETIDAMLKTAVEKDMF